MKSGLEFVAMKPGLTRGDSGQLNSVSRTTMGPTTWNTDGTRHDQ